MSHIDPASLVARGRQLLSSKAIEDRSAATECFLRAEQLDRPDAAYTLASISLGDLLLPRDLEAAARRIQVAADAGIPAALRSVALTLARNSGDDAQDEAERMLGEATAKGDVIAALLLLERWRDRRPQRAASLRASLHKAGHAPLPRIEAVSPSHAEGGHTPPGPFKLAAMLDHPPAEELCRSPRVRHVRGLLSAEECRFVIATARPHLQQAEVYQRKEHQRGLSEARTSSNATLGIAVEDFHLRLLQLRMARAAGAELVQAEPLEVMRYQPGQEYRPHRDYLPPAALQQQRPEAGQRKTTICVYLSAVAEGGGTAFPLAQLEIQPRVGDAVVFENLDPQGAPDPRSLHAGLPVRRGEKWLATLWIRQRNYRYF